MLAGQNVVVDHLVKIIQAIQIGRTTGSLMVTRGEGASYEVGTLVFLNGRVVQGRVGRREGREALNWLSTWGKCRYTFVLSVTPDNDLRSNEQSPSTDPLLQSRIPHARLLSMNTDGDENATESRTTGELDLFIPEESKTTQGEAGPLNNSVPYRSKPTGYGLQVLSEKNLSRIHRKVFLLVDGVRKVGDLMRLLQLTENEVLTLLYDLQDTGIIRLPSPLSF